MRRMNADLIRKYPWHPWQSVCPNLLWFEIGTRSSTIKKRVNAIYSLERPALPKIPYLLVSWIFGSGRTAPARLLMLAKAVIAA
jgi:hypothetical protein